MWGKMDSCAAVANRRSGSLTNRPQVNILPPKKFGCGYAAPREPRTLYVLAGTSFDPASGKVTDPYLRWVIYVPFATPQSTGLSTQASDGAPWLMSPGTAGAHIMISPPNK
jgi:hypothetical protein